MGLGDMNVYIDVSYLLFIASIAAAVFLAVMVADLVNELIEGRADSEDEEEISEFLDDFDAEWAQAEADGLIKPDRLKSASA